MAETSNTPEVLLKRLRDNEFIGRLTGSVCLGAAVFVAGWGVASKKYEIPEAALDGALIAGAVYGLGEASRYGRSADVIDAEMLRRQFPSPNPPELEVDIEK